MAADHEDFATAVGALIKGHLPGALENRLGRLGLDSAGGVQHSVTGTRVWWVNDNGELVEGSIPWERISGAPASGSSTHRLDNDLGYLTLDSSGGIQHGTTATGRVWWVNDQGQLQQGSVPWNRVTGAPDLSGTSASLKVVPLSLTTGHTQIESGHAARGIRIPIRFNAPIHRWRVHIQNWNPRLGQVKTGAVTLSGIWVADHAGNGVTSSPRSVMGSMSMPSDGSEFVSPWIDEPIGGDVERLLCMGYYGSSNIAPYALVGGSWQTEAAGAAGTPGATVTRHQTTPLDIWIEAETPASTPVIAGVGDSLTSGVGATLPVYESWLSQYTRKIGGLPMHVSHAGDSLQGFLTVNPSKVTRWNNLARADAVVWGLGSNDVSGSRSLTQMQTDFNNLLPIVEANIGPVKYASTVQPRNGWDATKEAKREEWNTWLTSRSIVRGILDFSSVVSTDGDTLIPSYNSGDGTHLSTAGYTAEAESIETPLTAPALATAAQIDAATYKSGFYDVTTLLGLSAGTALLEIRNGDVRLDFLAAQWPESGAPTLTDNGLADVAPQFPRSSVNALLVGGADTPVRIQVNMYGQARLYGYTDGLVVNGSVSWPMTRPIPAVLPGDPA